MIKMTKSKKTIRVAFVWPDISGYMAAVWRDLSKFEDTELFVLAFQAKTDSSFSDEIMKDINSYLLNLEERENFQFIKNIILEFNPDIILIGGWFHKHYRRLAFQKEFFKVKFIMGMDTPWKNTFKQKIAPYLLYKYLNKMSKIVVSGERSWQYGLYLTKDSSKLYKGLYGINFRDISLSFENRVKKSWPKRFLFIGRYINIKGIDILINAYNLYKSQCKDEPWELICCGQGPYENIIAKTPGIVNLGFVQPYEIPEIFSNAGVFILPSRYDPWPLVLVEACAAGLPIICTDACGSSVELVRSYYNGIIINQNDANKLSQAMIFFHNNYENLRTFGLRSRLLAEPYSSEFTALRYYQLFKEIF